MQNKQCDSHYELFLQTLPDPSFIPA